MPELPELEVICEVLARHLLDQRVERVEVAPRGGPIIVRDLTATGFEASLREQRISQISRRGKFLIMTMKAGRPHLVVNFKLTGRFQFCLPEEKRVGAVHVLIRFAGLQEELRYIDRKRMGQLYLTEDLDAVPGFSAMGPDALTISQADFRDRLGAYRGEIKGILRREHFIAGIGNAYADEILWAAQIHPFRKRPTLTQDEIGRLYNSTREVLLDAVDRVRAAMGEDIHLKPRHFFAVHMREGQPCPRCGGDISAITANRRITNFCRKCQPGGLIRGM